MGAAPGVAATSAPMRTPVWGTASDQIGALRAAVFAAGAVAAYTAAVRAWSPELAPGGLEIFGTATSLACVWLTRRQNVLSIPYGIVSVVAMGVFFFQIGLVGQGWLHLGYYVPVQFVGWWVWIRAGEGRTDLPVGWLSWRARGLIALGLLGGTVVLAAVFERLHGPSPYLLWDSSIVAASLVAQYLLITKRIESWWLWLVPVDISAILLYLRSDAEMFAALYTLYLVVASMGLRDWHLAWRAQRAGASAFDARFATSVADLPS